MKYKIAVVMGGYSPEFEISLKSGAEVCRYLNSSKFDVYPVVISKNSWTAKKDNKEYIIDRSDFSITENGKKINFDCVFNAIHGVPGENGYLKAYFNLIGLACTGCGVEQHSLASNKYMCNLVVKSFGLRIGKSIFISKEVDIDEKQIIKAVGFPCFVKPNEGGSSSNTFKVKKKEELKPAIIQSISEGYGVLVEEFLEGIEVSVGILTYKGELHILPIAEIKSKNEFLDYDSKWKGQYQKIIPAKIPIELEQKIKLITEKVYQCLGMSGFSRTDYIIKDNEPYFLEMNSIPGLTDQSIFPQQIIHYGMSIRDAYEDALYTLINRDITEKNIF